MDEHFAQEAAVASQVGSSVALLDHDALLAGDVDSAVWRVPRDLGPLWYRGWMIPTARYGVLSRALLDRGCRLLTQPDRYAAAHELPGWYRVFSELTPLSVWMILAPNTVPERHQLARLVAPLPRGPAVIKDFVKSRKHEWTEACYIPDVTDTAHLLDVVTTFVTRQEDDLAGGLVVRAFEEFRGTGEARVWWLDGEPLLVGPHPDTPELAPDPDVDVVRPAVRALGCRFVTTDVAMRADGQWRVVEVGDGQVSDLPRTVEPARLVAGLR